MRVRFGRVLVERTGVNDRHLFKLLPMSLLINRRHKTCYPPVVFLARRGWPVLVVDCGSALTFTAADARGTLAGGAILPGVRLQLAVLGTRTAQLPSDIVLPDELPPRQGLAAR